MLSILLNPERGNEDGTSIYKHFAALRRYRRLNTSIPQTFEGKAAVMVRIRPTHECSRL